MLDSIGTPPRLDLAGRGGAFVHHHYSISEMDYQTYHGTKGSWIPSLILFAILILRYLLQQSIGFQRFVNNQKVHWRKRLGYRDESKYRMGAGDGANTKFKRQG